MTITKAVFRTVSFGLAIAAAACADRAPKQAEADSGLARDLALASAQPTQPMFQDTAVAPAPTQAGAVKQAPPAPARTHSASRPVTHTPRVVEAAAPTPSPVVLPTPAASAPATAPAVAPAAEIGAGTGFSLTSGTKVCTSALPGDKFTATVNNTVTGSNGASIPAGATVVLEVAAAQAGQNADDAHLTFRVRAIVVGDKMYNVSADVVPEATLVKSKVANPDANAEKKKVIGGAIAGAILGQMIGHSAKGTIIGAAGGAAAGAAVSKAGERWEACLPAGAPLRLTLSSGLVVS